MSIQKTNTKQKYDAVIVGSGTNGIAVAIYLQQQGLKWIFPDIAFAQTLEKVEAVACY